MQRNAYFSSDKTLIEHWNAIELPRKIISQTWQTLSLTILISGYALGGALHTSQQKNVDPSPSLEALEFRIWLVFEDQELIIDPKDLSKQQVFVIHCLYWPLWHQFQHVHDLTLLYQTLLSCQFRLFFSVFTVHVIFTWLLRTEIFRLTTDNQAPFVPQSSELWLPTQAGLFHYGYIGPLRPLAVWET